MTYTSGSSPKPPATPESKLADRNWRWLNSWWIFAPIMCCGFFGFIGFLVAAIRTGKRHYWIASAIYAAMGGLSMALIIIAGEDESSPQYVLSDIAAIPFLIAAIGPIIHAAIKNRDYLTTIAYKGTWYAHPQATGTPQPQPSTFIGVSNSDYFTPGQSNTAPPGSEPRPAPSPYSATPTSHQAPPPPGERQPSTPAHASPTAQVDLNRATASDLVAVLNIDHELAHQVIAARDARGRFQNLDDLAAATRLLPHQLVRFRNKVTFGAPDENHQNPPTGPAGRILDY